MKSWERQAMWRAGSKFGGLRSCVIKSTSSNLKTSTSRREFRTCAAIQARSRRWHESSFTSGDPAKWSSRCHPGRLPVHQVSNHLLPLLLVAENVGKTILKNLVRTKSRQAERGGRTSLQSSRRDQTYQLAAVNRNAQPRRLSLDGFECLPHRGLFPIGKVHGDLRLAGLAAHTARLQQDSQSLHRRQSASRGAHRAGNGPGDSQIVGPEINVEGDQHVASTDRGGARCGMKPRLADIRSAGRISRNDRLQFLKTPTPNGCEVFPIWEQRGGFVEINRNLIAVPQLLSGAMGDGDTIRQSYPLQGNERDHVSGADARVFAAVAVEIDERHGLTVRAHRRLFNAAGRSHKGDYRAVVVRVHVSVQEMNPCDTSNHPGNPFHLQRITAFAEVGYALDQESH